MNATFRTVRAVFFLCLATFLIFSSQAAAASSQFVTKGNTSSKLIALTFDDGADGTNVETILQTLSTYNIKATFFLTGTGINHHPDKIKLIHSRGHELGNHSYTHSDFTTLTSAEIKDELERTEFLVRNTTGQTTKPLFRAPFGAVNSAVLDTAGNSGYSQTIHWNIDTVDWKGNSSADIRNRVLNHVVPGSIVLMHTGAGASGTPGALPGMIQGLKDKGYQFVTVSDLFNGNEGHTGMYVVKAGDTLYSIARQYKTSVSQIVLDNQLVNPNLISVGQALKVPSQNTDSSTSYTVKAGDTLYSIARIHNTTTAQLVSLNQLADAGFIRIGQVLMLLGSSPPTKTTYKVKAGDTLYSIAARYKTTVQKLAESNNLSNPSLIRIGQSLVVPLS
ncbi:LysM peptidoglycan-binding domain-containing protein [Halobacillus sp. A5]|uniref:LysM peptidoglycan-binding domain-containing protein n=1 Tax=Halobacillus sp. A5 TaxID=2880263 RepID=UPI0020A644C9|nr:LysM peptidoglycan-binding domain-containing protein [Halobacillus sp. A5]MCP3028422.1 LysM peptidoglycan-binding domain-containing protein [Halobacillus sp. A5]